MKKVLFVLTILALTCVLAFSVSAATPDSSKESVTLDDGTICPIWDTDGDALIWYKSTENADDGYASYDYVKATSELVNYNCGWTGESIDGAYQYQLGATFTVTGASGAPYSASTMVVVNMMDDVKITSGSNIGKPITALTKTFSGNKNLEYIYLPLGTVAINSESFKNCSKLKYCNLEDLTELRQINSQAFNGCSILLAGKALDLSNSKLIKLLQGGIASIPVTSIKLPSTLTTIGEWAFQSCAYVTSIDFGGATIKSFSTNSTFKGCNNLKTITGFKTIVDSQLIKEFYGNTFAECRALESVDGLIENKILTIPSYCTKIGNSTFYNCDAIRAVKFTGTSIEITQTAFYSLDSMEFMYFPYDSYLKIPNNDVFSENKSLRAIAFPKNCTSIPDKALKNCTNLQAVCLPENLVSLVTNGNAQGAFALSKRMYFVHDWFSVIDEDGSFKFDDFVMPERPDVYFFPETLTNLFERSAGGTGFHQNQGLNPYLVFGTNVTKLICNDGLLCECGTSTNTITAIFLGDMSRLDVSTRESREKYTNYVFANPNDLNIDDVAIIDNADRANSLTGNEYFYFCHGNVKYKKISYRDAYYAVNGSYVNGGTLDSTLVAAIEGTTHFENPDANVLTEASCTTAGSSITYCFCGAEISREETPALGHDFEGGEAVIVFGATLYDNASQCVACVRGCGTNGDTTDLGVVIMEKGYSSCDIGGIKSFTRGYFVNTELLKAYEEQKGISVAIGFAFALADNVDTESELGLGDFAVNMELKKPGAELGAENIDYVVRYKTNDYVDLMVLIAGYYSENGVVTFSNMIEKVSYNMVAAAGNIKENPDGSADVSVDIGNLLG